MEFFLDRNKHTDILKSLWKTCFYDDSDYINWCFGKRFHDDEVLSLWEDNRLCAMSAILSYDFIIKSTLIDCGFIEGLCTAPTFRMRHLGKKVTAKALSIMKNRGQMFGMLVPFHTDYYEKLGFSLMNYLKKTTVSMDKLPRFIFDGNIVEAHNSGDTILSLNRIYQSYMKENSCFQSRSPIFWENVLAGATFGGAKIYLLYRDNMATGYVYMHVDRDELHVYEICYTDPLAYSSLLAFLKSYSSQTKKLVLTLADNDSHFSDFAFEKGSTTLFPYAMVRIVDTAAVLDLYRDSLKKGSLIEVIDSLCPWNNGLFLVEEDRIVLSSYEQVGKIDVTVDVKTLSNLFFGVLSPKEAKARGVLSGDETVFIKACTMTGNYANLLFD